jgi:Tol biopolymer transport system component
MSRHRSALRLRAVATIVATTLIVTSIVLARPALAATTDRVNLTSGGAQASGGASDQAKVSGNGRYVVFRSAATDLVTGDTNAVADIFLRDRTLGTTERISVSSAGAQADGASANPAITPDGRYVVFSSTATNLVASDTNGLGDIFIRDRTLGTTERVSLTNGGAQATGGASSLPVVSQDGRYVAFESDATDLVAGDNNAARDVFVRDRTGATTERVSLTNGGAEASGSRPSISSDGRYVTFESASTTIVNGDTNGLTDVFIRDRTGATTERISVTSGGAQATGGAGSINAKISPNGRYVVFSSTTTDLVNGDTNGAADIFVRDRTAATTERVSLTNGGAQATGGPSLNPTISDDGRFVVFDSDATDLVTGDTNNRTDVFIRDRTVATTQRISLSSGGAEGGANATNGSVSCDGTVVAFDSFATNMVSGDTNGLQDVFARVTDNTVTSCSAAASGGASAPTEIDLSQPFTGTLLTALPVRMPRDGRLRSDLIQVGIRGCKQKFKKDMYVYKFRADLSDAEAMRIDEPFVDRIFSPTDGITVMRNACRFMKPDKGEKIRTSERATLTLELPDGVTDTSQVRITQLADDGSISTMKGTIDGSTISTTTDTTATLGVATTIELSIAQTAPSVTADIPVIAPCTTIGPAVTLTGTGGTLAIAAGTRIRVNSINADFCGSLFPPAATTSTAVATGAAVTANVPQGVYFDKPATLTLTPPAGSDAADMVPVALGGNGATTCLTRTLSGSGIATDITSTGTYGLIGVARPEVASVERSVTAQAGYHSAWAGQSVPTTLCPRQQVDVTFRLRNTGDQAWVKGRPSQALLGSNASPGNTRDFDRGILVLPIYNRDRLATQAEAAVKPGEVGTFTVRLMAPSVPGTYTVYLRPLIEGQWMEDEGIYFDVVVR